MSDRVVRRLASDQDYGQTMEGNTPLFVAIETGDLDLAESLLQNDVECLLDSPNHLKQTALVVAVILEDYDAVKLLLKYGANLESQDVVGKTAFLHAVESGKCDIVHYLIKSGCDVNVVDHLGRSALFTLAMTPSSISRHKCTKLVQRLIKAGYSLEKDAAWVSEDDLPLKKFQKEPALIKTVRKLIKTLALKRSSLRNVGKSDNSSSVQKNKGKS